jgi:hypothetical protein
MKLELNPGMRKFNLVDSDLPETRRAWFNPKAAEPLDLRTFLVIGGIALAAVFVTGPLGVILLIGAGAFIYSSYQTWQKENGPIDAYRFSRMVRERKAAVDAFETGDQCRIDNDVSKDEWADAESSKRIVRLTQLSVVARHGDVLGIAVHEGEWIAREIRQVTAVALRRGLVLHSTTFDAVLAMNKTPAYETIPWAAISRVRRESGSILIETIGGTQLRYSISTAEQERDESLEELNAPEYVNEFVIPFVRAAQRFLLEAHGGI